MRTFVFGNGRGRKVWVIDLRGSSYTIRFGRVGDKRRTQNVECTDPERARQEHDRKLEAKLAEGYVEVAPPPLQHSLEEALTADPDDLSAHMAYADYLAERDDPRGELVRIQLALENPDLSPGQREQLSTQERELYLEHRGEWLGGVACYVIKRQWQVRFIRGWLGEVDAGFLPPEGADALAWEPQARLLRHLVVHNNGGAEALGILARSPYLGNVRALEIGSHRDFRLDSSPPSWIRDHGPTVGLLVQKMPKLEELYVEGTFSPEDLFRCETLTRLRIFQWHGGDHYPLDLLARNESLQSLTHLSLCPRVLRRRRDYRFQDTFTGPDETEPILRLSHLRTILRSPRFSKLMHLRFQQSDIGDRGCREIVTSGMLTRLKFLDLSGGCITDAGARVLAGSAEVRKLERLDLSFNSLTKEGVRMLREASIQVEAKDQHASGDNRYLYR